MLGGPFLVRLAFGRRACASHGASRSGAQPGRVSVTDPLQSSRRAGPSETVEQLVIGGTSDGIPLEQVAPEVAPAGGTRSGAAAKYQEKWCPRGESNTRPRV